jgi:hypothetical protein
VGNRKSVTIGVPVRRGHLAGVKERLLAVARAKGTAIPSRNRVTPCIPDQFRGHQFWGGRAEHPASEMPLNFQANMLADSRLGPVSKRAGSSCVGSNRLNQHTTEGTAGSLWKLNGEGYAQGIFW